MNTTRITNRKEVWKCAEKEDFSLATYNILADFHIPARSDEQTPENWPVLYKYCETEDLYKRKLGKSSKRHLLLMEEVRCTDMSSKRSFVVPYSASYISHM